MSTIILEFDCGGYGRLFGGMVRRRIGPQPRLAWRVVDSSSPAGIPKSRCIDMAPQTLPAIPTDSIAEALQMTPISDHDEYRHYRNQVSARGLAQAPSVSAIAAFQKLPDMKEAIEMDVRALAQAVGGAERLLFVSVASTLGGTGTAAARVAGIAVRIAAQGAYLPCEARWIHVAITSAVLGDTCRTQRTLALEHRQFEEFRLLMASGASLRVPGQRDPISPPGPDEILLIASSPEAPRTLDDSADEFAAVMEQWLR